MKKIKYQTDQNNPQVKAYKEAVAKGMKNQHVVPRDDGWAVKKMGATKASAVFNTQQDAIEHANRIAKNQGSAVFIHGKDGRIRDRKDF